MDKALEAALEGLSKEDKLRFFKGEIEPVSPVRYEDEELVVYFVETKNPAMDGI